MTLLALTRRSGASPASASPTDSLTSKPKRHPAPDSVPLSGADYREPAQLAFEFMVKEG